MGWERIAIGVLGLFGVGCYLYSADQYEKRVDEQNYFSRELRKKEEQLAECEARTERHGEQVKIMAELLREKKTDCA